MTTFPLVLALFACVRSREAVVVEPDADDDVRSAYSPYLALSGVKDGACDLTRCVVLNGDGVLQVAFGDASVGVATRISDDGAWDTIRLEPDGRVRISGPSADGLARRGATIDLATGALFDVTPLDAAPSLPLVDAQALDAEVASLATRWAQTRATGGRTPFARSLLDPGGGLVRFVRTMGGGQLVRTTAPGVIVAGATNDAPNRVHPATVRVAIPETAAGWPAWLALHPSAQEAYLMAWPSASFVAFDPRTLLSRWTFPLEAPGHALFIDESGRFVVLAEGPQVADRWLDWPTLDVGAANVDPTSDETLRAMPQPPTSAVVVLDLARGEQLLRVPGAFERWTSLPDGRAVLVTSEGIARTTLPPTEPPR